MMMAGVLTVLLGSVLAAPGAALAETVTTASTQAELTESVLSPVEAVRARQWALTNAEWQRYQHLLQGVRGSLSVSTISPIEVLGIHARDEAERRAYAEKWVMLMHDDTERVLAFQRAYFEAWQRLFPDDLLIDPRRLPGNKLTTDLEPGDRLLFFTSLDCEPCDDLLKRLLDQVGEAPSGVGLDIYLVGGDIRAWARERTIAPELVNQGHITLNDDNGTLARLAGKSAEPPRLIHRRSNRFSLLPLRAEGLEP